MVINDVTSFLKTIKLLKMKIFVNIIKSVAVVLGFMMLVSACTEDNSDPMAENIKDVNANITAMDKTIVSPEGQVTVTGSNLDQVFRILLGDNVSEIPFEATSSTLTFTIPSSAPLGDMVVVNFFFSGKGLAQRTIEIMSPPTILGISPLAATGGEECHVYGAELYKSDQVFVGGTEVTWTLVDDKHLVINELPAVENGDVVSIVDESGTEIVSDIEFVRGTEVLMTDFENSPYLNLEDGISSNGNLDGDTREVEDVPYGPYYKFIFTDNGTSWGGNIDFYVDGSLPSGYTDNSKVYLYIDIKVSDAMSGRIMVQGPANVYGDNFDFTPEWQTFKLRLSDLYTGYGNGSEVGATPTIDALTGVKVQPPAGADSGNFGKTISVDNIKFIVEE